MNEAQNSDDIYRSMVQSILDCAIFMLDVERADR
jgi:hypothetical protein